MTTLDRIDRAEILPAQITFSRWPPDRTPILFRTTDPLFIEFLCPILGPTSTLLLHRLAQFTVHGQPVRVDTPELAAQFGVKHAVLAKALDRLERFSFTRHLTALDITVVRGEIAPLAARQLERLPASLQHSYQRHLDKLAGAA
jgi:hypothetical protein